LLLWVELNELLKEDDKEGDTDHAYETHTHSRETTQVGLWVIVAVAHGSHSNETHPEGVDEVPKVLGIIF
jgi:hypothetical protein